MNRHLFLIRLRARAGSARENARLWLSGVLLCLSEWSVRASMRLHSAPPEAFAEADAILAGSHPAQACDQRRITVGDLIDAADRFSREPVFIVAIPGFKVSVERVDEALEAIAGEAGHEGTSSLPRTPIFADNSIVL